MHKIQFRSSFNIKKSFQSFTGKFKDFMEGERGCPMDRPHQPFSLKKFQPL